MLRQLFKNKKAQNTAEYALLIALVVAGVIAMQTYAQRSLQARMRDAGQYLTSQTSTLGNSAQYEPYYSQSNYNVDRDTESNKRLGNGTVAADAYTNRTRTGEQRTQYDATNTTIGNGVMPSGI